MRPGNLYIKIFLSFIGILFITEILIFVLFLLVPGKYFRTRIEQFTRGKALMVREVVLDKIRLEPEKDLAQNEQLKEFIYNFGKILGANVWLQYPDGTIPVKSFSGEIPEIVEKLKRKKPKEYGEFKIYNRRHFDFYVVIPISFHKGENGHIHIYFRGQGMPRPEGYFALWLAVIGLIIALMVIPVSRLITKRVKELRQSALRISEGDLSHRVTVKSKDEIGDLARAFNRMTSKLESMIISSRELTANVSHELRTPLARIRISEELVREKIKKKDFTKCKRHLNDIREDIEELDRLIGRILELSKLDIHDSPLKLETINPSDLIDNVLERLQPVFESKNLDISKDLLATSHFSGDKEALHTAFLNILDNAAKFTGNGGHVKIEMRSKMDSLEVSITNSFDKMSEEDLKKIFDPFHRADKTSSVGSGLGLAITRKIVEKHGGKIKAINSSDGLEILVRLPLKPA